MGQVYTLLGFGRWILTVNFIGSITPSPFLYGRPNSNRFRRGRMWCGSFVEMSKVKWHDHSGPDGSDRSLARRDQNTDTCRGPGTEDSEGKTPSTGSGGPLEEACKARLLPSAPRHRWLSFGSLSIGLVARLSAGHTAVNFIPVEGRVSATLSQCCCLQFSAFLFTLALLGEGASQSA